jgi:hypothetical protein
LNSSTVRGSPTEKDTKTSSFAACTGVEGGVVELSAGVLVLELVASAGVDVELS